MSDLDAIEIFGEYESPIRPMAVEEEIMSMPVSSSSIPKYKRQTQRPSPTPPQKRQTRMSTRMQGEGTAQTRPLSSRDVDFAAPRGVSVHDILGYVSPMCPGAKVRQRTKS